VVDDYFFRMISYSYDESVKTPRVRFILFHLSFDPSPTSTTPGAIQIVIDDHGHFGSPLRACALKAQLTELYGAGRLVKRDTTWKVRGLDVTLTDGGPFAIAKP
jgi:hypothetical protein